MISTDRILREQMAGPQIVQDGRAVRPGGGGAGAWPTERKVITETETYLTRDDCGKLIWWDGRVIVDYSTLFLPTNPVIGDALWICALPWVSNFMIAPSRETAIVVPTSLQEFPPPEYFEIYGYWFCYRYGIFDGTFRRNRLLLSPIFSAGDRLTWIVMTYTGRIKSVPTNYVDANSNGQYDPGEVVLYRDITLWECARLSGSRLENNFWRTEYEPFYD